MDERRVKDPGEKCSPGLFLVSSRCGTDHRHPHGKFFQQPLQCAECPGNNYNEIQSGGESLVDSATQMITGSGHQTENLLARVAGMSFGLVFLGVGISVMLLGLAFGILVGSPIEVGASRFFMRTREESTGMGELFWAFRQGQFWHIVLIMLVRKVKIFLWGLLFVIPGIVKFLRVPDGSLYSGGKSKSSDV